VRGKVYERWIEAAAAAREAWRLEQEGVLAPPVGDEDITPLPSPPLPPGVGTAAWDDSLRVTFDDDGEHWIIENDDCEIDGSYPTREAACDELDRMRLASSGQGS
jgi:hypothetical protein